jgi:hypothetical protein
VAQLARVLLQPKGLAHSDPTGQGHPRSKQASRDTKTTWERKGSAWLTALKKPVMGLSSSAVMNLRQELLGFPLALCSMKPAATSSGMENKATRFDVRREMRCRSVKLYRWRR